MTETKLNKNDRQFLRLLKKGVMNSKNIRDAMGITTKQLNYTSKKLTNNGLIKKIPDLLDMRSHYYDLERNEL